MSESTTTINPEVPEVPLVIPVEVKAEKPVDQTIDRNSPPVEVFRSYDQGIMDGLMDNSTTYLEQFIEAFHFKEFKNKSIYHLREQVRELIDKEGKAREKLELLREEKLKKETIRETCALQISHLDMVAQYWKDKLSEAKDCAAQIRAHSHDYNLFAGAFFFTFALLFMAADYTICLSIVANSLKIGLEDGHPTFASHLFALAMSGLAIVLKPAYDRLIEKPYHNDKKKKAFAWVIVLLAFAIIIMLWALGIFREEVISLEMGQASSTPTIIIPGAPVPVDNTNNIQASTAAKIGIISSTILFAIAGAVCLGISIPVFHKNFRIYWNRFRSKFWNRQLHKICKDKSAIEVEKVKAVLEVSAIEDKIDAILPDINVAEQIKEKRTLIQMYQHGEMVKNIAKSKALYLSGHERGQKLIGKVPQDWLYESIYKVYPEAGKNEQALEGKPGKDQNPFGKRTRPFVALRRIISHNFKKKWQDGNDINIEYYNFD